MLANIAAGLMIFSSSVIGQGTTSAQSTFPTVLAERVIVADAKYLDHTRRDQIEQYVRTYFEDVPILAEVAFCESTFRQLGLDGKPLRGNVNGDDVGIMQINEYYHKDTADKLGYELSDIDGNLGYARYLFKREGVKPWSSSSMCWKKTEAYENLVLN